MPASPDDRLVLRDARLHRASFAGRHLEQFAVVESRFSECDFTDMVVRNASLGAGVKPSVYSACSFDRSHLTFMDGGTARFEKCSFRDVRINGWGCFEVELIDCTFTGRIRKSWFNGTVPEDKQRALGRVKNEFRENDFSGADLVDVGFRTGIDLTLQRLPVGPDYVYVADARQALDRLEPIILGWPEADLRNEGFALLAMFRDEVTAGQEQLHLRKGPPRDRAYNRIVSLLREVAS